MSKSVKELLKKNINSVLNLIYVEKDFYLKEIKKQYESRNFSWR